MPRRPDMFGGGGSSMWFRGADAIAANGELDLRNEFDLFVYGDENNIRHGHLVVVRHLRRNNAGAPDQCSCRQDLSREADPDCSYCDGEGYLWDESWYWCYSMYSGSSTGLSRREIYMPTGKIRTDYRIFFFRYDTAIRYGDKIVEMKLDNDGQPIVPYIRESIYQPQTIQKYRSDNGRVEYIQAYCREESAIRSDTPS